MKNVVIIGAGAVGMGVASKLARENNNFIIHVFQNHDYISLATCAIPYYVADDFNDSALLNVRTINDFRDQSCFQSEINFYLKTQIQQVDLKNNMIYYQKQDEILKTLTYDYLVIATGAKPRIFAPFLAIKESKNVFTVNNKKDAIMIKKSSYTAKKIVIIGGSYIGLEMAESFLKLQKEVVIIEKESRLLSNMISPLLSQLVYEEINKEKATVYLNSTVTKIITATDDNRVIGIKLQQQKTIIPCDLLILATGIMPNTDFLTSENIKLARNGAIIINQYGQVLKKEPATKTYENVFSAGDCATVINQTTQQNDYIALATTANKLARIIANNIAKPKKLLAFLGTLGTAILRVKKLEIACTGHNNLNTNGNNITSVFVKSKDIPSYFNNAKPLYLQIFYDKKTYQIKAAEMAGYNRSILRINALAVAIWNKMDVRALEQLDFAYAPPFSSTADIIHLAARKIK